MIAFLEHHGGWIIHDTERALSVATRPGSSGWTYVRDFADRFDSEELARGAWLAIVMEHGDDWRSASIMES